MEGSRNATKTIACANAGGVRVTKGSHSLDEAEVKIIKFVVLPFAEETIHGHHAVTTPSR
jgi:hypothetical protein